MSITKTRAKQIIKEELGRAMNEMTDDEYNAHLQRQHGPFTSPENVRGTPEYDRKNEPRPPAPKPSYNYYGGGGGGGYSEYDNLYYGAGINEDGGEQDMDEQDDAPGGAAEMMESEMEPVDEAFGRSGRGGRYGGYYNNPLYSRGGSGRMSDAEARERGGRGYDEPYERDAPRGPRGGLVSSTVTIYTDPSGATDKFNANLGSRLDKAADVFLGMSGYDGMSGNLVVGTDPVGGYNKPGDRWVLAKAADGGYTFTVGETVGNGASPSEALRDAAEQGFQGSDVVLGALGGGGLVTMGGEGGEISESRLHKLAGILKD